MVMCGKSEWCCIHTHMHTHTYIQRTSRVATSVLSGRLVLAKVQADQKKRIITGSEYSSPPPSQTRFCRKATPLACKRNTLDKKTSLNISFGTRGSIIWKFCNFLAGSFSAVSKRNFARKYAFDSIFQALQDLHPFAPLQSQNFRKKSV